MASNPTFVVKKTRNLFGKARYRVNLRGANGENIMTSEQFESKSAAVRNITAAKDAIHVGEIRMD